MTLVAGHSYYSHCERWFDWMENRTDTAAVLTQQIISLLCVLQLVFLITLQIHRQHLVCLLK